jgi:MFS family permease
VYLANRSAGRATGGISDGPAVVAAPKISANVKALGVVSLVTDISSEMITAVLPLYFVFILGMTPLAFGFLDGLYSGVTAFVQLIAGHIADRWERRKGVAVAGYGLSAVCKLGLLAAGTATGWIGVVLAADRTGKGFRTAPRDALISLSSEPANLGRSFGVHRALDTAGALLGPLLAYLMLTAAPDGYNAIFVVSFCIAAFGVLILIVTVRDKRDAATSEQRPTLRAAVSLLRVPRFGAIALCTLLLSLVSVSDSFVYLLLQRRLDLSLSLFPLLPLGTSVGYLLLSIPLGRLADRIGRAKVFVGGYLPFIGVYLLIDHGPRGWLLILSVFALHGSYYAATNGVLMAYAGPLIPSQLRASGMAILQTGIAAASLASSVLFGAAWTLWGPGTALGLFTVGLVVVVVFSAFVLPTRERL